MKNQLLLILMPTILFQIQLTAEQEKTSPLNNAPKERIEWNKTDPLDQCIHTFLKKEGLLNVSGEHPFETPKSNYKPIFLAGKDAERSYNKFIKRNNFLDRRTKHLHDVKTINKANKLLHKDKLDLPLIPIHSH